MKTTFAEILEMRRKLDEALAAKMGQELASGFNIEMDSYSDNRIAFRLAYTAEIKTIYVVNGSYQETPKEAFDSAMEKIQSVCVVTKGDKIRALQNQIDALKA